MALFVNEICLKLPKYWSPSAWTEHVPFAFWIVDALKPRVYVELGVHYGMSYFAACQIVAEKQLGTRCYAVDTWSGDEHSGFYSEEVFRQVDEHNRLNYSDFSSLLRMRFDQALDHIPDGSVDLLHVDGRHFYDDVKADFESWIPKLSECAVVMFHDTEVRERDFGVWKLWSELENRFPSFNFLHGHGLGVIAFGPKIDPSLTEFFAMSASRDAMASFRRIFMSCGKNLSDQWERRVQRAADEQRLAALQGELEGRQAEFAALQGELEKRQDEFAALQGELEKRQGEFAALQGELEKRQGELSAEQGNRSESTALIADLRVQLAWTRGKPLRVAGDYLQYRLLRRILKLGLPLSAKTAARFANSAAKRNPQRSLLSTSQLPAPLTAPAAAASPAQHLAEMTSSKLGRPVDASKKTIMVVSHEASRTGAPILAWNLVNELSRKYNVVSLILGGGELRDDFLSAGVALFEANRRVMDATEITAIVNDLCNQHDIAFALVNSVESRSVLPALKTRGVPTICLLHEFASYTRPATAFSDVFEYADQVVFSTRITLENALSQYWMERNGSIHLFPQGKCLVPARSESPEIEKSERLRLDSVLRPNGRDNHEFVVIGAGALETRKGLDLFVECANRVINSNGGGRFRFVWIGSGYDPERDTLISVYIADQIKRAGISAQVKIVEATSEIEHAYANADLLLLPSRLDPLPNVAIDALVTGIPVVCFERTTGIADFLTENGLGDACVARYLDSTDLSRKILALASNDAMRADVKKRGQHAAVATFDFARYVERLDEIASHTLSSAEQAKQDVQAILASGEFRADFYRRTGQELKSDEELVADYLQSFRVGGVARKPMPGFHPGVYVAHHDAEVGSDPFVRFLRDGKPAGPWSCRVMDNSRSLPSGNEAGLRTAIHLHVFYPETLPDIISRLEANAAKPDLFISAPKSIVESLQDAFSDYKGKIVDMQAVPNRGRDIAPLLTVFGRRLVKEYDVIGHFHTKKSPHIDNRKMAETWFDFLLESLIGGAKGGPMLDRILAEMSLEPKIAIAYPDDPHVISWTENRGAAENLALRMGLRMLPEQFNFPMGNMFWIRSSLLARFVALDLAWDDYPAEPLPIDGTMLHAIERLFGVVAELDGKATLVTNVRGVSR
jgi:glycosyltransferase involved in cell wall biosynthesis